VTWIAPDLERSEDYPERRNEPEQEMLRDWLDCVAEFVPEPVSFGCLTESGP
jgi:hypothetical protein